MPVHVLDHPLAAHIITHLRDKSTKPATFRTLCYQISLLLAIEATRDLPCENKTVETPLETVVGQVQGATNISLLTIVSSPEGVAAVETNYPELPIFTATLDRELNASRYIL